MAAFCAPINEHIHTWTSLFAPSCPKTFFNPTRLSSLTCYDVMTKRALSPRIYEAERERGAELNLEVRSQPDGTDYLSGLTVSLVVSPLGL